MSSEGRWAAAELVATVVLPAISLIVLTDEARLGPVWGLAVALAPPILWGITSMVREGQVSALALIAMVSVLLTGGVGIFELDPRWFALKEALLPAGLGLGLAATAPTRFAVIPVLLDRLFDLDAVRRAATERGLQPQLDRAYRRATAWAGLLLVASSGLTFVLARWIVQSPTGTEAFGDELGRYTLVSVPALLLPSTLGMAWVLDRVMRAMEDASGEGRETFLR